MLTALGHEVLLILPSYVKAYVKRGKGDALNAEAICEAVLRPTMSFMPVKTIELPGIFMIHRVKSLFICPRMMLAYAILVRLEELSFVANPGC